MYERYSALFALRNRRTPQAVEAIIAALGCSSALLRHEVRKGIAWQESYELNPFFPIGQVAYVLGQLQDKAATAALVRVLAAAGEHPMVRHEAAEALGAIAGEERREARGGESGMRDWLLNLTVWRGWGGAQMRTASRC